eukprot:566681_1
MFHGTRRRSLDSVDCVFRLAIVLHHTTMQIGIDYHGHMMGFNVDRDTTIHDIKMLIQDRQSISIEQQKLVFIGRTLSNARTLEYYNIVNTDSLVLQQQATSHQFWISCAYFGSFVGLGLFMGSPGPILLNLEHQTHSSLSAVSYVFSARAIGYIIGSIIFGLICDKYASHFEKYRRFPSPIWPLRPHHLFGMCLIILSICMSTIYLIRSISALTIIMAITGVCSGGIDCFGNVLLLSLFDSDNEKDQLVAPYMQLLHFAFAIGAFLSPLILQVSFVFFDNTYKLGFWLMSAEAIIFGVIILFIATPLRRSPSLQEQIAGRPSPQHNRDTASSVMSDIKHITYGSFDSFGDASTAASITSSMSINTGRRKWFYRAFVVLSCAIFLGVYVGSEVSYGAYITTYAIYHLKASDSVGRYMSSVYWGGLAFGRLSAVYISKKLKPVHMLVLDLMGCFVASAVLFVANESMSATWIASILYGFFMASIFPCIFLIAEATVKVDGRYASIMIFGASCGEFFIPTTTGNLMDYFGQQHFASITIILVIILFCVMLILLLGIYIHQIYRKTKEFFSM